MQILHRLSGEVIYGSQLITLREVVIEAVGKAVDLSRANLSRADRFVGRSVRRVVR